MNMDMVFQSVCQVVRTILDVWITQIKWAKASDWIACDAN
jgi:hypothetical protein